MKLSRTGWNNVIIFSVMIMIILLNFTNDKLFHRDSKGAFTQDVPILAQHAVILTLKINQQINIERVGQNWRSTPASMDQQALVQMMRSWQLSTGTTTTLQYDLSKQTPIHVKVMIAGKDTPYLLSLYPTADQLLLLNKTTKQWLSLPIAIYYQLLPNELFKSAKKHA